MSGPDELHGLPAGLSVLNESGVELPLAESELNRIARVVFEAEGIADAAVELVYVDEEQMLDLNRRHTGGDYVTDSLAFPYHESPDAAVEGTIVQCAHRIAEQAEEFNQPLRVEFARLLIHGVLHLAGHEDETEQARERMTRLEDAYLAQTGFGPVAGAGENESRESRSGDGESKDRESGSGDSTISGSGGSGGSSGSAVGNPH